MSAPEQPNLPAKGQFLVYQAEDGKVKIDVRLHGETAWLKQAQMAELFRTSIPNVSMHIRNIYAEGELQSAATVQEFLTVREEGGRQVSRSVEHYNLDAIISVGHRVKSAVAKRFRIWATQKLREFIRPIGFSNPNGIATSSPGLERSDYPGWRRGAVTTPTGLHQAGRGNGRNPLRVADVWFTISQGSSFLATLGFGAESLWDSRAGASHARDSLPSTDSSPSGRGTSERAAHGRRAGDLGAALPLDRTIAGFSLSMWERVGVRIRRTASNVAEILEA